MKTLLIISLLVGAGLVNSIAQYQVPNTNIDMQAYLKIAQEAAAHRESRRLSEGDFIRFGKEPGTLVLDARSREMFDRLHVKGAVNLSFPDITIGGLAGTLPDKSQRILIYCNNNFRNESVLFGRKSASASLNLSTYIALFTYGYTNAYELGPLLDVNTTKIKFVRRSEAHAASSDQKK